MEKTYSTRDGRYQHIEVRRETDDIRFHGDRSSSECVHTLKPKNFAAFVASIGQPEGTDTMVAIGNVLESDPALVWAAIHDGLTISEFSWQS